jgi:integrase/recombinase XerD
VLLLRFTARETRRPIEALSIADVNADRIGRFLKSLERERRNGIATRNARLAAIHTFARFLVAEHPEHLESLQRVLGIPFKRGARQAPIEYLEKTEIEGLLTSIDRASQSGQRDYALFALMFNTGARVQEILNLRVRDLRSRARAARCACARTYCAISSRAAMRAIRIRLIGPSSPTATAAQ